LRHCAERRCLTDDPQPVRRACAGAASSITGTTTRMPGSTSVSSPAKRATRSSIPTVCSSTTSAMCIWCFACVLRNSWDTVVAIPVNISGDRAAKRDRCCRRARLLHDDERRADDGGEHFGLDPTGTGFDQGRATPLGRCRATRRRTSFTVQRRRKSTRALYGCICSRCRARDGSDAVVGRKAPDQLVAASDSAAAARSTLLERLKSPRLDSVA
jgi:hypothetical protein